ncbi:hypothetical protein BD324DRAFT_205608 [Kockovaella imperatae]|uniref:ubiquitinyl hydrolase 1 n=1 Tax=Kockovaella imperatae TaxID=4999 RepID=A0A1Y1U767_9TREE|nr:hypothetical protein BD324DRAFT_205608 [Kockovaella imperatae]ORX33848.1 hypothetical protein BD324DRAFT_205608 [Kockovaella imperatae]
MAKLEVSRNSATGHTKILYEQLFSTLSSTVKMQTERASSVLEAIWLSYRESTTLKVPFVPDRATNDALSLRLSQSGQFLDNLLSMPDAGVTAKRAVPPSAIPAIQSADRFNAPIYAAVGKDQRLVDNRFSVQSFGHRQQCLELAKDIRDVLQTILSFDHGDPEDISPHLLTIFELWVRLDRIATGLWPLLKEFDPCFSSDILDALQLLESADVERLRQVQDYLQKRKRACTYPTVTLFSPIGQNSFAVRFVAQSSALQALERGIRAKNDSAREKALLAWQRASDEFDEHTTEYHSGTCRCTFYCGKRDVRGCTRCWHGRARFTLTVQVHEDYLPSIDSEMKAVIFELGIDSELAEYRDVTWLIFKRLLHPGRPNNVKVESVLHRHGPLTGYRQSKANLTLGSRTKYFQQTHYKFSSFGGKPSKSSILLPCGASFYLLDDEDNLWPSDFHGQLTLQHLCHVLIPQPLEDTSVFNLGNHPDTVIDGPSSYQTIANQTKRPSTCSDQEFAALQRLLHGKMTRWPNLLLELGATNLGFSNVDTSRMVSQLSLQAGPYDPGSTNSDTIHVLFKEPAFCSQLFDRIRAHFDIIRSNWREVGYMSMLVTLTLRALYLCTTTDTIQQASRLLLDFRETLLEWIISLRQDFKDVTEDDVATRTATYIVQASLLCRRTFNVYLSYRSEANLPFAQDDLAAWTVASAALQENISVSMELLDSALKRLFHRDARLAFRLGNTLRQGIRDFPEGVSDGMSRHWLGTSKTSKFTRWTFQGDEKDNWLQSDLIEYRQGRSYSEPIQFHLLEGHLLMGGGPRGKLPAHIRECAAIKILFKGRHLVTYPCRMPGLSHRLDSAHQGHRVYFGTRDGYVVIRAESLNTGHILEFLAPDILFLPGTFDLPNELRENRCHWINLSTGNVEVRHLNRAWKPNDSDWIISLANRTAFRRQSQLVGPQSGLFRQIASIFGGFVAPEQLTVYQPGGALTVRIPVYDLTFHVNKGRLECRELQAEIDPDQDAGTWYGLRGKLFFRDVQNKTKRFILVPLGSPYALEGGWRPGCTASIGIREDPMFGRFEVDDTLGRLTCVPEPALIYNKALIHALTTFCSPDPLTGRTGTEEAAETLRSAVAQPWQPLANLPKIALRALRGLLPKREYYPQGLKCLQKVEWDDMLPSFVQSDAFEALIYDIEHKSFKLALFSETSSAENGDTSSTEPKPPSDLRQRGELQQAVYAPGVIVSEAAAAWGADLSTRVYNSRHRRDRPPFSTNVYNLVYAMRSSTPLDSSRNLTDILEESDLIGGVPQSMQGNRGPLVDQIVVNFFEQFGELVDFCRRTSSIRPNSKREFRFALLAFSPQVDVDLLHWLAIIAMDESIAEICPPRHPQFAGFKKRECPTLEELVSRMRHAHRPFSHNIASSIFGDEASLRAEEAHRLLCEEEALRLAQCLISQWPQTFDVAKGSLDYNSFPSLHLLDALVSVEEDWERRLHNKDLEAYVDAVEAGLLHRQTGPPVGRPLPVTLPSQSDNPNNCKLPLRLANVLQGDDIVSPLIPPVITQTSNATAIIGPISVSTRPRVGQHPRQNLKIVLDSFLEVKGLRKPNTVRQEYARYLSDSLAALDNQTVPERVDDWQFHTVMQVVESKIVLAREHASKIFQDLRRAVLKAHPHVQWLVDGNLFSDIASPATILPLLRQQSDIGMGAPFKQFLTTYGLALTELQRLQRILHTLKQGNRKAAYEEITHAGHENWDPMQHQDWLSIELDCNILIRPTQVDVARAIISPRSGRNSLLQMNMGQGKTSVIMPMVVAELADGESLVRITVPKPLVIQTAQVTQSRIGGLVGRSIAHIPFSRRTSTTQGMLEVYESLHRAARDSRGILLTTTDHLLSFKLRGWQRLIDGPEYHEEAARMLEFQKRLSVHARDILDESDHTLSVKTQLIYPSGAQTTVDGHPFRWLVAEGLLALIESHLPGLQRKFGSDIQIINRNESYPTVHFLRREVQECLQQCLVDDICSGKAWFVHPAPGSSLQPDVQGKICRFLLDATVSKDFLEEVGSLAIEPNSFKKQLLTARGLMAYEILFVCLAKRWNVQYGLSPTRHPVAVPFEAKGVASAQAEFGHPDVAIVLTCLAFYYEGLTEVQLRHGLRLVLASEDPAARYERWHGGASNLKPAIRHWNIINLDDQAQISDLWGHLRYNRHVIDDYLNTFVFPSHAKQFAVKLQASAWDVPNMSLDEIVVGPKASSGARTTGFSGTNDNRQLLPGAIQQDDLTGLLHTNAEVLTYLLEPRNQVYNILCHPSGQRLSEEDLLRRMKDQRIRILIDAGAFVLEMDNKTLAATWLKVDTQAKAAVFFTDDGRAMVMYRGAWLKQVPLLATPFADDLSECVVYLDEAHTRGIDLKLPPFGRGALTLALGQTKDFTVQAALRLRQVASTQSVTFFAPPEVDRSIRDLQHLGSNEKITSSHIVFWLLEQTCRSHDDLQGLHRSQGGDFAQRMSAQYDNRDCLTDTNQRRAVLDVLQQPEAQSLQDIYLIGPSKPSESASTHSPSGTQQLSLIERYGNATDGVHHSAGAGVLDQVEQEREVEFQVEEVREIQKPHHWDAFSFPGLHGAVERFVRTGDLETSSSVKQAYSYISGTSLGAKFKVRNSGGRLFVSPEFSRTIKLPSNDRTTGDNFLRPVHWIIWSCKTETALVVIPEEVELIIPLLLSAKKASSATPNTCLVTYSAPVTKDTLIFDDLQYYTLPALPTSYTFPDWLRIDLGILSGRLYLPFKDCDILAQLISASKDHKQNGVGPSNGYTVSTTLKPFVNDMSGFLLEWLSLRRQGQDVYATPMGYTCTGRVLNASHPFFTAHSVIIDGAEDDMTAENRVGSDGVKRLTEDVEGLSIE